MVIRCRGDEEYGLAETTASQIRLLDFDGNGEDHAGSSERPLEYPIHGEILRARPEIGAVVHAHPTATLLCGLAGIPLRPVFGAYDPWAMRLAVEGVPVYPRAVLINSPALGRELVAAMGASDVCLLRGHGVAVAGRTVPEAVLRAIRLERLAAVCWDLAARGPLPELAAEDVAALLDSVPHLPRADEWVWRSYAR